MTIDISRFADLDIDELLDKLPTPITTTQSLNNANNNSSGSISGANGLVKNNSSNNIINNENEEQKESPKVQVKLSKTFTTTMTTAPDDFNRFSNAGPLTTVFEQCIKNMDTISVERQQLQQNLLQQMSKQQIKQEENSQHHRVLDLVKLFDQLSPQQIEEVNIEFNNKLLKKKRGSGKSKTGDILINKYKLDFGAEGEPIPLQISTKDSITITAPTKAIIKYRVFSNIINGHCSMNIEPRTGVIEGSKVGKSPKNFLGSKGNKPSKTMNETINFELKATSAGNIKGIVHISVDFGGDFFLVIDSQTDKSVIGLPLEHPEINMVEDLGYTVPSILKTLRMAIMSTETWLEEGIFLISSEDKDISNILHSLSLNEHDKLLANNIALASTMKLFFRELPSPLLDEIPLDKLMVLGAGDVTGVDFHVCVDIFNAYVTEPKRSMALWLCDLLCYVAQAAQPIKSPLTIAALAICFAPNLCILRDNENSPNPDLALLMEKSASVINFLKKLIESRTEIIKKKNMTQ